MPLLPPNVAQAVGLPTDYAAAKEVTKIQKALFPHFRERGFATKGRSFNRLLPTGLVQVVSFFTMPATSSLYGQFAIEAGVFVPEVWFVQHGPALPKAITTADCVLRNRIPPRDCDLKSYEEWEALAHPELIERAREATVVEALAFFDRFPDRNDIMADLSAHEDRAHGPTPTPIISAIIEWNRGRTVTACQHLEMYLAQLSQKTDRNKAHETYVRKLIVRLASESPLG